MPRPRRWLTSLYAVAVVLVLAELGARVTTLLLWKLPLWRDRQVGDRLARAKDMMPRMTVDKVLGSTAERYPAPIYPAHPGHRGGSLPVWSTYGELTPAAFPKPPVNDKPTPGVVRIAFVGG